MNIGMGWRGRRGEYRKRGNRRERRIEEEQKRIVWEGKEDRSEEEEGR